MNDLSLTLTKRFACLTPTVSFPRIQNESETSRFSVQPQVNVNKCTQWRKRGNLLISLGEQIQHSVKRRKEKTADSCSFLAISRLVGVQFMAELRLVTFNLSLSRRRLAVHFDFCLPFVCVGCRFFWPRATSRGCFYCRPMISLSWCESCPFLVVRASFASQPPLLARRESRRFFPTVSVSVLKGERCSSFNISAYINDDLLEPQAM